MQASSEIVTRRVTSNKPKTTQEGEEVEPETVEEIPEI
jgi:hypothetical protein